MNRRLILATVSILIVLMSIQGAALASPARLFSMIDHVNSPFRVALDSQGALYVSEPFNNAVVILNRQGQYQRKLNVPKPLGVAVDASGRLYVGSEERKTVEVYGTDLNLILTLGAGQAEGKIEKPNSIALDSSGRVYVVDSNKDMVRVFDSTTGSYLYTIGSTYNPYTDLSPDGRFNKPTAVSVNSAASEIYVTDLVKILDAGELMSGARLQVFDMDNLTLKRSFGQYGVSVGQLSTPADVANDRTGKLYVVDTYQQAAIIFDTMGNLNDPATGTPYGALYDMNTPLRGPMGVALAKNNIAYVTSNFGNSVEVYALDGYTTMDTTPSSLSFIGTSLKPGIIPSQNISISNAGTGTLSWTASKTGDWFSLSQTKGDVLGGTEGTVTVSVNVDFTKVQPGTFTGSITITSDFGQNNTIPVTLTVLAPPTLALSSGSYSGAAKINGAPVLIPVKVKVLNSDGFNWWTTIDPSSSWLTIAPAVGMTTTDAVVKADVTGLAAGKHDGSILFSATDALLGNGIQYNVSITVVSSTKITVTTNRPEAAFTITGPQSYTATGTGTTWSAEDVPLGDYTVTFASVPGYKKPKPKTGTIAETGVLTLNGTYVSYKDLAARKSIVAARGPWTKNDARIKGYKSNGVFAKFDVTPLDSKYGANVAVGDIDGDGTAELIVGAGPGSHNTAVVRILRADKTVLTEFTPFDSMFGVNVAAADLNGDGIDEVIVAPAGGIANPGTVKVYSYDSNANAGAGGMVPTGIEFSAYSSWGANIAAADLEGDYALQIITGPGIHPTGNVDHRGDAVKIWSVDTSKGMGNWKVTLAREIPLNTKDGATVAAGDVDNDGKDEIIVGSSPDPMATPGSAENTKSQVIIFKGSGTEIKRIPVFDEIHGVNVAAADLDGDGFADIIAGMGPDELELISTDTNVVSTVMVYSGATGKVLYTLSPYKSIKYGVHVAVGDLGL